MLEEAKKVKNRWIYWKNKERDINSILFWAINFCIIWLTIGIWDLCRIEGIKYAPLWQLLLGDAIIIGIRIIVALIFKEDIKKIDKEYKDKIK